MMLRYLGLPQHVSCIFSMLLYFSGLYDPRTHRRQNDSLLGTLNYLSMSPYSRNSKAYVFIQNKIVLIAVQGKRNILIQIELSEEVILIRF